VLQRSTTVSEERFGCFPERIGECLGNEIAGTGVEVDAAEIGLTSHGNHQIERESHALDDPAVMAPHRETSWAGMDSARWMREASAASRDENRPTHTSPEWPGRDTREEAPGTWAMATRRAAFGCCRSTCGSGTDKVTVRFYRGLARSFRS
jgi:hypothetical protein